MLNTAIKIDPRSKLAVILTASLLLMFQPSTEIFLAFLIFVCLLLLLEGAVKKAMILIVYYLILIVLNQVLGYDFTHPVLHFISFWVTGNLLFVPNIAAILLATNKTTASEWIVTLHFFHLPKYVVIPVMVVFRFFPILVHDTKTILGTLKLRGLISSNWDFLKSPSLIFEFLLVPIIVSVERVSQNLSQVAYIRGLNNDTYQRTSVQRLNFQWFDWLIIIILVCYLLVGGGLFDSVF